ncbi:MAG: shikimate kinase [Bacteroidetes bacterium]|jgi:shikimate kinase|nr:shikimate kinase [Bacteroidota bacterium]
MKIFLWGMMGSGKSTLGLLLARALNLPFVDLDAEIEQETGQTIAEIFDAEGQEGFRRIEQAQLRRVLGLQGQGVISCGGGTPCYYSNAAEMLAAGTVIYLQANEELLAERLKDDAGKRPLLREQTPQSLLSYLAHTLHKRAPYYKKAHVIVPVAGKSAAEVVAHIVQNLPGRAV